MDSVLQVISIVISVCSVVIAILYLRKFDSTLVKVDPLLDAAQPLIASAGQISELTEMVTNTVGDPEAFGAIIDRAASTAVLTWKHSMGGEHSGDVRLQNAADEVVQQAISERVLPSIAPELAGMLDMVMEFAGPFIGDDPRRRQAIRDSIMRFAMSAQKSGLMGGLGGELSRPGGASNRRYTP